MSYGKGSRALSDLITSKRIPASFRKGFKSNRTDLNLDVLIEMCHALGTDPCFVLAVAMTVEMREAIGEKAQAQLALELVKLVEGKQVTINGRVDHKHTHESVSESDAWIAAMLGDDENRPVKTISSH